MKPLLIDIFFDKLQQSDFFSPREESFICKTIIMQIILKQLWSKMAEINQPISTTSLV